MKRVLSLCLACISLLSLPACSSGKPAFHEPSVAYHITKRHVEHDTGDINLTTYTYNDAWVIQSTQTYLNGSISSGVEYSYNEDSTIVTMTTTSAIYDPTVSEIHQEFDASGKVLRATSYNDGRPVGTTEYSYDEKGRETLLVSTDPSGNVMTTLTYEYDKNGNLISYTTETPAYSSRQEHTYGKNNRISETKTYRNGELTNRIQYSWEGNIRYGKCYHKIKILPWSCVLYILPYFFE